MFFSFSSFEQSMAYLHIFFVNSCQIECLDNGSNNLNYYNYIYHILIAFYSLHVIICFIFAVLELSEIIIYYILLYQYCNYYNFIIKILKLFRVCKEHHIALNKSYRKILFD